MRDRQKQVKRVKERYYSLAHHIREEVKEAPRGLKGELRSYQLTGLNWLVSLYNNRLNGILADEMGLGKTVQTIALIAYLREVKGISGPHMILAPLSTLHGNWKAELERWLPSCVYCLYEGSKEARKAIRAQWFDARSSKPSFNVLLTTDAFVLRDKNYLRRIAWDYLVVDEAHRLKNPNSKLVKVLNQCFSVSRRLALTGTPLQNDLQELWALLNFLMPELFPSALSFNEWFNAPLGAVVGREEGHHFALSEEEQLLVVDRLHKILRPFLLRREMHEVADEVPRNHEFIVCCPLSGVQTKLYDFVTNSPTITNKMLQCRKICNHPYLFCGGAYPCDESVVSVCGKLVVLDGILARLKAGGHRVLIFSQMTSLLDVLGVYLDLRHYPYLRLDGSTPSDQRVGRLQLFNQPGSPYFCFILSTKAGALGLNLQSADTVIIYDSDWNPQNDIQAQSRAHRIGQKRQVVSIRFVTPRTVEEEVLRSAGVKLSRDALAIKAGEYKGGRGVGEADGYRERVKEALRRSGEVLSGYGIRSVSELDEVLARGDDLACFRRVAFARRVCNVAGLLREEVVPPYLLRCLSASKKFHMADDDLRTLAISEFTWASVYSSFDIWSSSPTPSSIERLKRSLVIDLQQPSPDSSPRNPKRQANRDLSAEPEAGLPADIPADLPPRSKRRLIDPGRAIDTSGHLGRSSSGSGPLGRSSSSPLGREMEPNLLTDPADDPTNPTNPTSNPKEQPYDTAASNPKEQPNPKEQDPNKNDNNSDNKSQTNNLAAPHRITGLAAHYPHEVSLEAHEYIKKLIGLTSTHKAKKQIALNKTCERVLKEVIEMGNFPEFVHLPSKELKDYYERVKRPICLDDMLQYAQANAFEGYSKIQKYLERICHNARLYNGSESVIFRRALQCSGVVNEMMVKRLPVAFLRVVDARMADRLANELAS